MSVFEVLCFEERFDSGELRTVFVETAEVVQHFVEQVGSVVCKNATMHKLGAFEQAVEVSIGEGGLVDGQLGKLT